MWNRPLCTSTVRPGERARHQLAAVADHRRRGEVRDLGVGDPHRVGQPLGELAQARAQHDRRRSASGRRAARATASRGLVGHRRPRPTRPASRSQQDARDRGGEEVGERAGEHGAEASRARSCFRSGASAPMPPSWMPTELKLAKPASANDAIVNERGSSWAFIGAELRVGDELVQHHAGAEQAADRAAVVPRARPSPTRSAGRSSRAPSAGWRGTTST